MTETITALGTIALALATLWLVVVTRGLAKDSAVAAKSTVEAAQATARAAQSSLDVFTLIPETPDILKEETARPPPKRHIYRVWLISSGLCLHPLIVRSPSTRQLIVNELCNSMALRNNPPKWWITLLKKLMPTANYERLLRLLDICLKIRQNITT